MKIRMLLPIWFHPNCVVVLRCVVVVDYDVALATSWLCMYKFRGAGSKGARGAIAPSDVASVEKRTKAEIDNVKSTCCPIPWRSWEPNQQHQWRKAFQILSLPIHRNSHPAWQCFMCHGNYRLNGKTWGIELPITNSNYNILTQWRASRSLKFIILSFRLLLKIYIVQK